MDELQLRQNKSAQRRAVIIDGLREAHGSWKMTCRQMHEYDADRDWETLGFSSMWESLESDIKHQLGVSKPHLIKSAAAGEAISNGAPTGSTFRALVQFSKLNSEPEKQKAAFKSARAASGADRVSEAVARKAVGRFIARKKVTNTASGPKDPQYIKGVRHALAVLRPIRETCDEAAVVAFDEAIAEVEKLL